MADNVQSAMFEILKSIQLDMTDVKTRLGRVEGRLESVEGRLEKIDSQLQRARRDGAAMLIIMRATGTRLQ